MRLTDALCRVGTEDSEGILDEPYALVFTSLGGLVPFIVVLTDTAIWVSVIDTG